ncbi:MAG: protein serine/threonine phosphatase [Bacteroidetes bacterium]|jgi:serine phosphatase RsbU (regulator of sigma subunit)|nr:protein serine/threonine phosphatase [Bacteroidota bacterium]
MRVKYFLIVFLLVLVSGNSLKAKSDTTSILNDIKKINELFETNVDSCKPLIIQSLAESKQIKFDKGTTKLYLLLTQYYILKGLPDYATSVLPELEKAAFSSPDKNLTVSVLLKAALIYSDIGDFANAVKKAIDAQKVAEGINNFRLLAKVNHDLGLIYSNKEIYKNSLSYYKKGLEYALLSKDTFSIANMYARIGGVYNETQFPDSGLYFNLISLRYFEIIKHKRGIGVTYNNIAGSYELKKNYSKAIEFYTKALKIREELGDDYAVTIIYYNLGIANIHLKNYDLSEKYLMMALQRNKAEKDYPQVLETLKQLCVLHSENKKLHLYKEFADEYMYLKDSITTAENIKAVTELQEKYESEKKEKNIIMLKKENEKQEEVSKSERKTKLIILGAATLIVILMSIFGFILYKRYKLTQKQKDIIELQKEKVERQNYITEQQKNLIEVKQKEILDSINYAKQLQRAILATPDEITANIKENFLFYKPKDIVAGDFYFFEKTSTHLFLAAADCTGHGVPGAMVSVVCCNALTRAIREFGLSEPGRILDKTNEIVLSTFEKSGQGIRDGMDISLIAIERNSQEIKWSGANNPLWYLEDGSMKNIKADKQPIGFTEARTDFKTHTLSLTGTTQLYLFTDGFADQFGGSKGKKFKYSNLQELLVSISQNSFDKQQEILDKTLSEWKGNLEQVDDILIIGIKV